MLWQRTHPIDRPTNYEKAGQGIGVGQDLVNNPDLVATDAIISFKTAIWFWMTTQDNKPSCHDVILGQWTPSHADKSATQVPGYGVVRMGASSITRDHVPR